MTDSMQQLMRRMNYKTDPAVPCYSFTLIELLVVISIIAILSTMLLPALSTARDKAYEITCVSNMKQIGMSTASYASDANGFFPLWYFDYSDYKTSLIFRMIQFGYFTNGSILLCPAHGKFVNVYWTDGTSRRENVRHLKINDHPDELQYIDYGFNARYLGTHLWINGDWYQGTKMTQVRAPAATIEWCESRVGGTNWRANQGIYFVCPAGGTPTSEEVIYPVHEKQHSLNVTWVDGHVDGNRTYPASTGIQYQVPPFTHGTLFTNPANHFDYY